MKDKKDSTSINTSRRNVMAGTVAAAAAVGVDPSTPEGMLGVPSRGQPSAAEVLKAAAHAKGTKPAPTTAPPDAGAPPKPLADATVGEVNEEVLDASFFMKRRQLLSAHRQELLESTQAALNQVVADGDDEIAEKIVTSDNPEVQKLVNMAMAGKDFDKEEVVAALEDPGLKSHMQFARDNYAQSLKKVKQLRTPEQVRDNAYKALGKFSTVVKSIREASSEQNTAASEISIIGRHLLSLSSGRPSQPHFPEPLTAALKDPQLVPILKKTNEVLQKNSAVLDAMETFLNEHQKSLNNLRNEVIRTVDEFVELTAAQAQTVNAQMKVLKMFDPILYKTELENQKRLAEINASMKSARMRAKREVADAKKKAREAASEATVVTSTAEATPAEASAEATPAEAATAAEASAAEAPAAEAPAAEASAAEGSK